MLPRFLRIFTAKAPLVPRAMLAAVFCLWFSAMGAHALAYSSTHAHQQHAKVIHVQKHSVVHFRANHLLAPHSKGSEDALSGQPRLAFRDRGENRNHPGSGEKNGASRQHDLRRVDVNAGSKANKLARSGKADPTLGNHVTKYSQATSDKHLISSTRTLTRERTPNVLGAHHKIKL